MSPEMRCKSCVGIGRIADGKCCSCGERYVFATPQPMGDAECNPLPLVHGQSLADTARAASLLHAALLVLVGIVAGLAMGWARWGR